MQLCIKQYHRYFILQYLTLQSVPFWVYRILDPIIYWGDNGRVRGSAFYGERTFPMVLAGQ